MKPLTEEQRQMVASNMNLVYKWFNENRGRIGRNEDQMMSALHIALMRTAQKWNPELGTFSTLAYLNFWGAVRDVVRENNCQKNKFKSIHAFGDSGYSVKFSGKFTKADDFFEKFRKRDLEFSAKDCIPFLTTRQKVVLDLKLQGWSNSDIGRHFEPNIHRERVRQIVDQIGERMMFARKTGGI